MHRQPSSSRVADPPQITQSSSVFSPKRKMDETADLPLFYRNSSFNKKEISRSRLDDKLVHLIPIVVLLCLFILWWFSYEVNLEIANGRIAAASLLKTHSRMFSNHTHPPYPSVSEMQTMPNVSITR